MKAPPVSAGVAGFVAGLLVFAVPIAARTGPANSLASGRQVFDKWCAACHGRTGRMAGTIALEAKYEGKVPAALEDRSDLDPEIVRYFVRNGVSLMAPFRKTEISDTQLEALTTYLAAKPAQRKALTP